jgi:acyl-CoA dehydrogenase
MTQHDLSPEDLAFRDEVRAFLAAELSAQVREGGRRTSGIFADYPVSIEWQKILAKRGWSAPNWPVEWGGCGWSARQHDIFASELAAADAPQLSPLGLKMAAPVIIAFGTEEQKKCWLPGIRDGSDYWCQGYSEPGSGSDLASLQCRARLEGDHWIINGTKIWTTHAHWANHMFCLVRTDSNGKSQQGISFLMFSLSNPGITIRPIISISGDHEFNQVFFDDARVPADALVGEANRGWTIAKFLLEHERGGSSAPLLRSRLARLRAALDEAFEPNARNEERGDHLLALANAECRIDALHAWEQQVLGARIRGGTMPHWMQAAPSMEKVLATELKQHLTELGLGIAGPYGATGLAIEEASAHALSIPEESVFATRAYLNDRAASIYGGTNEIQRNLIARHLMTADMGDALFDLSETQSMISSGLRSWLANNVSFEKRAEILATPEAIEPLWRGLGTSLGLLGAALPEELGGIGGGLAEQLLISQALGDALTPEPYIATAVLGASLLQQLKDPAANQLLQGMAEGQVRLAVAAFEPQSLTTLGGGRSKATEQDGQVRLTGRKALVRAAPWATHWLVSACDDSGDLRIALVDPSSTGITKRDIQLADGAWATEIGFDNVQVQRLIGNGDALLSLEFAFDVAMIATGAEAVGVMQRMMRETIEYVSLRKQFGQPLAAFQALQHRLADMYTALVQAAAMIGSCIDMAEEEPAARARRASSAHVAVLRAARAVGQGAVQLHGGMGMTDELAIGHGFKRLTVIEQQFGSLEYHLRRVGRHSAKQ